MIGDVLVRVGADTSSYTRSLNAAQQSMMAFGATLTAVGTTAAGVFTGITVASGAAIAAAVSNASSFESAFAGVRKTTEATEEQFAVLSKGIRDMSKELPATADEIAGVAEVAGQLGIKQEDILDFTRVMTDMGVATNMAAEDAATSLARFMNIVGTSPSDVDRLGSVVVDLGNNLATTEQEIVNMALRLAGAGRQVGMTEADIMSMAGALSAVGIRAEAGGTAFSRVMLNMSTAVKSGSEELQGFADVAGMSASEFATAFEDDAAGAIVTFIEGLREIHESGGDVASILSDIGLGEIRVRDSLLRASGASDLFAESLERGNKAWDENTALTDEAQERYDTFASKVQILMNRFSDLIRTIGTPLMDVLSDVIDAIDPVISYLEDLAESFENASDDTQRMVATGLLLVPVLSLLAAGFFALVALVGLVLTGLATLAGALGISTGAAALLVTKISAIIVAIVGAITAVGAFAVALIANWDEVVEKTEEMADSVVTYLSELPGKIAEIATNVKDAILEMIPDSVKEFVSEAVDGIVEVFNDLRSEVEAIFSGDFSSIEDFFARIAPTIIGLLIGGLPGVIFAASSYIPAISEAIVENVGMVGEKAQEIITSLLNGIETHLPKILEAGVDIVENVLQGIVNGLPIVIEGAQSILLTIIETLAENLPLLIETGAEVLQMILNGIAISLPQIIEVAATLITTLIIAVAEFLPQIIELGVTILLMVIQGIIEMLPQLIETGIFILTTLIETVIELLPIIIEAGISILLALVEGISNALPELIDAIVILVTGILEVIVDSLPLLIEAAIQIVLSLIVGLFKALPDLIGAFYTLMYRTVELILSLLFEFITSGAEIVWSIIKGIGSVLGNLLVAGYELISELLVEIGTFLGDMFQMGIDLIVELIDGIIDMVVSVGTAAWEIGTKIIESIDGFIGDMADVGKDLIKGLIDGVKSMAGNAASAVGGLVEGAYNKAKSFLGIKSPSRLMRDQVGKMIGAGLILGMEDEMTAIEKMAQKISEAATPEQPKLAGLDVGDMRGQARNATQQIHAEVRRGDYETQRADNRILGDIRDELKKQKDTIIEMDRRVVGRLVEPEVTDRQRRTRRNEDAFA